ncbi:MAG: hypothetical protein AAGF26_00920 [Cyanobacteria bacterium P01_G01_bin.49]
MKYSRIQRLILALTIILGGVGLETAAFAQASQQDEVRYVQEMAKYFYEEDKNQAFTVQEVLDDGYGMCEKIAEEGGWENLAQDAIRSGLGLNNSQPEDDSQQMAKLADKYLCDV